MLTDLQIHAFLPWKSGSHDKNQVNYYNIMYTR
jgi:hypothetical protein